MTTNKNAIGSISILDGTPTQWETTYFTKADLLSTNPDKQKDVQHWLFGLYEPWSDTSISYDIHPSYRTGIVPDDEQWVCDYTSIVYDDIIARVHVYAATPAEALTKCQQLIEELLEKYYIKSSDDDE